MTADNAPSPFVVTHSASSEPDTNWRSWYPFDAYIGSSPVGGMGWLLNPAKAAWIQIDLGSSQTIGSYRIYSTSHNACPRDWTLEGSDTGAFAGEETVIDTRVDIANWGADKYIENDFPVTSAFRYYRINITDWNGTYIGIGQIQLYGAPYTVPTIDNVIYAVGSGSGQFVRASKQFLSIADSDDWNFGADDFDINFRGYFASIPSVAGIQYALLSQCQDIDNRWLVYLWRYGSYSSNTKLGFYSVTGGVINVELTVIWSPTLNTWYKFKFSRVGEIFHIYIDDVDKTLTGTQIGTNEIGDYSAPLIIATQSLTYIAPFYFDGHLDDIEIIKGVAGQALTKSLSDSISFTENISKDFSKPVSQSFTLSDTFSRTWDSIRSLADSVPLSDLYSKLWNIKLDKSDSVPLLDSKFFSNKKQIIDDINFSDVFVSSWVKLLALSDLQVLSDNVSHIWQSEKHIQDQIDFVEKHGVYFEKRILSGLSFMDIISMYIPPKLFLFITDKLGASSSLVKFFDKSITDIGSLSEYKEIVIGKHLSDYMNLQEMRFLVSTLIRNISDSVSLSDVKNLFIKKPFSDSAGLYDTKTITTLKDILDNLALSDLFSHISGFSKSIVDNLSVLDNYTKEWIAKRNIVESFSLQETKEVDYKKSNADYLSVIDSYSKLIGKNINESHSLLDTLSIAWTVLRNIADDISLSDLNFFSIKKSVDDSIGVQDFFLYVRGRYLALADLQVLADNIVKGVFKSNQEQVDFIDYHGVYMEKRTLDNLNFHDVFTSYMQGFLSIAEGVSVTDNIKKVFNKILLSAESLIDSITKKYGKNLYDYVSLGDSTLLYMNNTYYISLFNRIDLYDAIAKRIILYKSDNLSLVAELQNDGYLALQDNISLTDHLSMKVMKVLGEVIPITDEITQLLESEPFYFDHGLVEPRFVIEDLRVYGGAEMHFYPEQSVDVRWKTRYFVNDLLFDPDSHEITVYDPKDVTRVVHNSAYLVRESTGVYKYTFNIPADVVSGDWHVKIKGIIGTWTSVLNIHLEVRKT
jgi:hypothetical protein